MSKLQRPVCRCFASPSASRNYCPPSRAVKASVMPDEKFQRDAGLFARVKDDGRADAALIALWGQRQIEAGEGRHAA